MRSTEEIIDYYSEWKKILSLSKESVAKVNIGDPCLVIDVRSLSKAAFDHLYESSDDAIRTVKEVVRTEKLCKEVPVRFINFPKVIGIKELKNNKLNKFVSVKGLCRSITKPQAWIVNAYFQCKQCGSHVRTPQPGFRLEMPSACICGKSRWEFIPEKSITVDYQIMVLQESPEGLSGGEIPAEVEVRLTQDLVGRINPGNQVNVSGVLKLFPQNRQSLSLQLRTMFDANNIEVLQKEYEDIVLTESEIKEIEQLKSDPSVFSNLVKHIAPSIYGHDVLKEAVLLQLFGGVRHENADGTYNRGDIHILIVGDPGVAKSKLLDAVMKLCPRGVKSTGGGSTKAGLTASAVQNSEGQWVLEAGAVVLADRGHLILDEIDKMGKDDRAAIHEAMEQQTVSVSKAGINTTLQARCSILAAANPKTGRFDNYMDIAEQIDMPPTLLSRFDLIFTMTDKPDKEKDKELAFFLLNRDQTPKYKNDFIRKYIAYAKTQCFPKMTREASSLLEDYYVNVRSLSSKTNKTVPITPRQLEALIRLSEASARARLSGFVEAGDAQRAIHILDKCLKYLAYDPETGVLDIDKLNNKMSHKKKDMYNTIIHVAKELEDPSLRTISRLELVQTVAHQMDKDKDEVDRFIDRMVQECVFISPSKLYLKFA